MRNAPLLLFGLVGVVLALGAGTARAQSFQVEGRFLYEDRVWDQFGYTGTVQNLPIRFADVEVVDASLTQVVGTGTTDADGNYSITASGAFPPLVDIPFFVRCYSETDNSTTYHIKVVDTFVRTGGTVDLGGSTVFALATPEFDHEPATGLLTVGDFLIQDLTGAGIAQAFNILDNAVDAFDYLASSSGIGRYPTASEFVVFGWNGTSGSTGSNYFWQGIFIASTTGDTDGWSDTVILHEAGHWASDMFGNDDNPGGSHFIGDNFQDPRLSYGEGYATVFCAQVREFRAPRLNLLGVPVDDHVSIYADLGVPPAVGVPGALEFAYDFETGLFENGNPIGQIGTANETNVTSAMWDLLDGPGTDDESPGTDDEPGDDTGADTWAVVTNYMTTLSPPSWITIEDFYTGWFVEHGAGYMQAAVDSAFIGLAGMRFETDIFEPDDDIVSASPASLLSYSTSVSGGVVINELDQGSSDLVELVNTGTTPVDLTGWKIKTHRNGFPIDANRTYTFPAFTLYPGAFVVVHEGGDPADNGPVHLYGGTLSIVWFNGDDGACILEDDLAAAVDFVRWDNVSGGDANTTPTPAGTGWTGTLFSAPGGKNIARDENGTDTDDASDFDSLSPSIGAPNFLSLPFYTIYPENDVDVLRLDLTAGQLAVVSVLSPHSAGEPRLELLDGNGAVVAANQAVNGIPSQAELQFLVAADTTLFARVTHVGPYTDFAPLSVAVYVRPDSAVLSAPVALGADPDNAADIADPVELNWLNGGAYDEVRVYRDGGLIVTLPGTAVTYIDAADRGLYLYEVAGVIGGLESSTAAGMAFAGLLDCYFADGLESGTSAFDLDLPWARTSLEAADGVWSLTDSPAGNYGNNENLFAEVVVPTLIQSNPVLEFDHICITEATFDFGIVELSQDFGTSWTPIAQFDMDDHPGWNDGTPDPGDWVHEAIDLSAYQGEKVRIRFRLLTDGFVTEDGWYVDNIALADSACGAVTAVPDLTGNASFLRVSGPNPFSTSLRLALTAVPGARASVRIFDAQGRLIRTLFDGDVIGEETALTWDGRDRMGRRTAAGFYLIHAAAGAEQGVRRVVKLR